jgi:hypothetical protein
MFALFSVFAFGQTETGSITGTVTDPTGAVVSGAKVTATDTSTGAVRTATTGSNGGYNLSNLPPAPYEVSISAPGFSTFKRAVTVTVASVNEVSARMTVGAIGTTVEVVGSGTTQVETQSSELSQEVNVQQVAELPSLSRNPYNFVSLAGNTSTDMAGRGANGAAINGMRSASTDILLDGGENVDLFSSSLGEQVPQDSVQEFRVTTSDFNAEYGRASGGVVNVATKSGTNSFHGSAYEFNRISHLASNTYDNNANGIARAPFTRNQFGYSVGGPIIKNKLFFFENTEWTRVRATASTTGFVPDPAFLALTNANTQAYFQQYGTLKTNLTALTANDLTAGAIVAAGAAGPLLSAIPASTPVLDEVSYTFPSDVGGGTPQNTYNLVGRVDFNLSDKTQMFGRYTIFHDDLFPGTVSASAYQGWDTGQTDRDQNVMYSLTHLWTNNFISNTKISLNRLTEVQGLASFGASPGLYVSATAGDSVAPLSTSPADYMLPGYLPYSPGGALPFGGPQNVSEIDHSFSWTRGRHSFKFGGEYIYIRDNRAFGAYETSIESLGGATNTALDGMLSGQLVQFTSAINPQGEFPCERDPVLDTPIQTGACTLTLPAVPPSFSRSNRYNDGAVYFQDSWKVTPRFSLNYGLRWEYYGVQHAKHADQDANLVLGSGSNIYQQFNTAQVFNGANLPNGNLWTPRKKNFGPRVGFAYDIFGDGKTSLRGGYGIAYERNFGNVTYNIIQNPPNYAVLQISATPTAPLPITNNNLGALSGTGTSPFPSPELRGVNTNMKTAYASVWNLSMEREVARNTVFSLEYSGSRGIHGYTIEPANGSGYGPAFTGLGCDGAGGASCANIYQRLNLQYGNINFRTNGNDSWHDAMNAKLSSSNLFKQGINLTANYTWAHTIDDSSATFGESDEFSAQLLGTLNPFDPGLDKGDSDFDVRNRVSLSAVWTLPYAQHMRGVAKEVLDGWEFTPIFSAQTGNPYTMYDCTQNPGWLTGFAYYDYNCARYIPSGPVALKGSANSSASNAVAPNLYNYETIPAPLVYGNAYGNGSLPTCDADGTTGLSLGTNCTYPSNMSRRNAFRQPGTWKMDMGIYKNFKVTERVNLQFRSEFYNLFNHSNYYTQVGNEITTGGTADLANLLFGNTCPNFATGSNNGQIEYTQYNGTSCATSTTPATWTVLGKKGVQSQGAGIGTGSLGERRYVQLALRVTF